MIYLQKQPCLLVSDFCMLNFYFTTSNMSNSYSISSSRSFSFLAYYCWSASSWLRFESVMFYTSWFSSISSKKLLPPSLTLMNTALSSSLKPCLFRYAFLMTCLLTWLLSFMMFDVFVSAAYTTLNCSAFFFYIIVLCAFPLFSKSVSISSF